jgi:NifU-like protein involved in Fe-S cluster formation
MQRLIGILFLLSLVGCGADVASSAATAAAAKAKEAEAAQHIKDRVSSDLEAASQQATKRLEEAEKAAQ